MLHSRTRGATESVPSSSSSFFAVLPRIILAAALVFIPTLLFEKYTFHLYLVADPNFFSYSGWRWWVDLICFGAGGIAASLIVTPQGRQKIAGAIPPVIASAALVAALYLFPLCPAKECYVSSTDGLASLRDFLLFASIGVVTSTSTFASAFIASSRWRKKQSPSDSSPTGEKYDGQEEIGETAVAQGSDFSRVDRGKGNVAFDFLELTLMGYALSFYPIMHILAGVSVPYPQNYLQWFLAGAPSAISASMLALDRFGVKQHVSPKMQPLLVFFSGLSGISLCIILGLSLPCPACANYGPAISSTLALASLFTLPALLLILLSHRKEETSNYQAGLKARRVKARIPVVVTSATIIVTMLLLWGLFFAGSNYEASVVNTFGGVQVSRFSPLEVGGTFVYDAGYLAIPRVVTEAVGVNISFGSTTAVNGAKFPGDFLAAGVGDQSPNCCKDGLDLYYRADVALFSNGSEYALARAWWACDLNAACGGYSWQQPLHVEAAQLPSGALSRWVKLEMNWTGSGIITWYYQLQSTGGASVSPWIRYSSYTPPAIQSHYWDAGMFYVGEGNRPAYYAYFFQFGVSSAYPITDGSWRVYMQCPMLVLNGVWTCAPRAGFINGVHSFWKVLYTSGESYEGVNFSSLGNHEVEFYYYGSSPADGTPIW